MPVGPPPDLSDDDEPMDQDYTSQETTLQSSNRQKTIRFADDHSNEKSQEKDLIETELERRELLEGRDDGDDRRSPENDKPRPTSLQQKMLAMAGQDIDQFMKEARFKNFFKLFFKAITYFFK